MAIDHKQLGKRLRRAREQNRMTQEDVAKQMDVSRSTIAQMELGKRAVTGIELSRLAYLFGKSLQSLLADATVEEEDALVALFRLHPDLTNQQDSLLAIRQCLALGRELHGLEHLLDIERDLEAAAYPLSSPSGTWDAIQQGERIAGEERRRLGLGLSPLPDIAEMLEAQGVHTAQVDIPEDISGLTLIDPEIGFLVVANRHHHVLRRRFSFAHEYCHVLADRDQRGVVSWQQNRHEFIEVRANAFAANFLMPAEGVRQFMHALGKGRPSRMEAEVFDEQSSVRVRARSAAGTQEIQIYDVVQLAHYFGASRSSACYRLKALGLISPKELERLLDQNQAGEGRDWEELLGLPKPDHQSQRNAFRRRFLGMGLEALRRENISRAHLIQVADMVEVSPDEVDQAISALGLDINAEIGVHLPGERLS
ncbi:MAG: ImmA/IrrE family metallo-endopeptidase [Chromatiales bacterium]|nr:ImmA/IrrE family metallo-endopeptidase [Chromatiales bacterium]MYI21059.1 ImmA/IrrE family metallo-endopeptidase [Acidimicrobiia bacterium]